MIKIIDSTLSLIDEYLPTKEQLLEFCGHLSEIGIKDIEISKDMYKLLETLPSGFRFYMRIELFENKNDYPGIYRFFINHGENEKGCITERQINDVRELVHLRQLGHLDYIRIIGLDDLFLHDFLYTFTEIKKIFRRGDIIFLPEDTYGCATGLAVEWLLNGGEAVTTSFCGIGSRAALEEVYVAMNVIKRFKPNQSLEVFVAMKDLFETITGETVPAYKPVLGERIFEVESGIHVDGIIKNPSNYEAYPPEKVGQKTEFIIGKHSGRNSIVLKCKDLELEIPTVEQIKKMLVLIKEKSVEKRNSITDEEFVEIYKEVVNDEQ